jgi:hypothetical protein
VGEVSSMQFLFWKAFIGLWAFDTLLLGRNFARLHRIVRGWPVACGNETPETIDLVSEAINRALMWYPKHVLCLQRSAVTTCVLRSHGINAQMVLGAQKSPFKAHAWVEVNGRAVNETNMQTLSRYGVWERC